MRQAGKGGFTLIEMVITVAILGVLASVSLPLARLTMQRHKEQALRANLRQIREAIDAYKQAVDEGKIARTIDESGYPPTLETLVDGVENIKDPAHARLYFLRRLPADPMLPDSRQDAAGHWGKRSYSSAADDPQEGKDVFDVYSLSSATGIDGIAYQEW